MSDIFVLAEHRQGELREVTLEMLTMAGQLGSPVTAVLFGSGVNDFADKCASFADRVIYVDDPMFENYNSAAYQAALVELIKAEKPGLVLLSLIHISEPTRLGMISYAVFCLKKT